MTDFVGTKLALINRGKVLAILRDNKPRIDFPGMWDFPGGARENNETPLEVAIREVKEELSIDISGSEVVWQGVFPAVTDATKDAVFIVINISDEQLNSIILGTEGRRWKMMKINDFISTRNVVPGMQTRLKTYINSLTK